MSRKSSGAGRSKSRSTDGAIFVPAYGSRSGAQPIAAASGSKPQPGLHIVATPIGNLGDITLRALSVLADADVIACEDTRVTGRLLRHYGLNTSLTPYHEHNAARARPALIRRLKDGETVALVSDAGTPLVSDPGYRLVHEAVAAGIAVSVAPGPSATLAALVVSGLPSDRFFFAGFPPSRQTARRGALAGLSAVPATLLFLESTRRLARSLADMASVLGPRPAAVARELTKLHEEVRRGTLDELAAHYAELPAPKGEIVIVVAPPPAAAPAMDDATLDAEISAALRTMSVRDAAATVATESGLPRRRVYERALALNRPDPK